MICAGKRLCRTRRWPGSPRRRLCRRGRPGWILCTPRRCSRRTGCSCRFRLCLCRSSRRFAQAAVRGWMERSGSHIARFAEHGWTKRFCRRLCRNGSPSRSRFRNPEQPLSPASEQENEIILEEPAILADEPEPAPVASQESVPVQMPKPAFFPASAPDDGRTHILYSGEMNQIEPVVGWLVCVLGGAAGTVIPTCPAAETGSGARGYGCVSRFGSRGFPECALHSHV